MYKAQVSPAPPNRSDTTELKMEATTNRVESSPQTGDDEKQQPRNRHHRRPRPTFSRSHEHLTLPNSEKVVVSSGRRLLRGGSYLMSSPDTSGNCSGVVEIEHSHIKLLSLLGHGTFSEVYSVSKFSMPPDQVTEELDSEREEDENTSVPAAERLVVKVMKKENLSNVPMFASCAADIVKEGIILARVQPHPHVIRLYGRAPNGIHAYSSGYHDAFFLLLEKLETTLDKHINAWRLFKYNRRKCLPAMFSKHISEVRMELFQQRMQVISDLANAVVHLHSHSVIHRDLKPANVGFDHNGVLKLFDFDVSRILPGSPSQRSENDTYNMTKCVGTKWYMSPECGLGKPYNAKSDVYSFAIVAYEVFSLTDPYLFLPEYKRDKVIFTRGVRPALAPTWSPELRSFFQQGWHKSPEERPVMKDVEMEWNSLVPELLMDKEEKYSKFAWLSSSGKEPKMSKGDSRSNMSNASTTSVSTHLGESVRSLASPMGGKIEMHSFELEVR